MQGRRVEELLPICVKSAILKSAWLLRGWLGENGLVFHILLDISDYVKCVSGSLDLNWRTDGRLYKISGMLIVITKTRDTIIEGCLHELIGNSRFI